MAETIQLSVNLGGEAKVIASLEQIDKLAAKLKKPIDIQINSNASKELAQFVNAQAKLAKAEADSAKAQARITEAEERTRQARLGLLRETQRLNVETAKQSTETRKAATAAAQTAKATAQLALQQERTATQTERTNTETARAVTEQNRLATQTERTATEQARFATQQERTRTAQQRVIRNTQQATRENNLLGDSLGNIALKMAVWQVMGTLISAPLRAMHEALDTMKEVDTELTNIQKVTNMSDAGIKALGSQAYSTASKYGVAANDYLSGVAEFSKAGYGDISADLGELATKTQLVGDVTADMANKMILSVDAAYDMKGSVTELSTVLDKMNEVENNYATSIEKITEGMPIVASTASMVGLSIDELIAALGTITAKTQESGTSAARALRALILNIIGDTQAEIEEGVTWTAEEIESLSDILKIYSKDAVEAANATGKVVNPMEAIAGLAKSFEEGALTEAKLIELTSNLGGKLRTNQLLALIENFDTYKDMLVTMTDATGSADKEIGVMLDSWEAKTNILKNTWTEFMSNLVETDTVKGAIDVLTGFINVLDSGATKAVVTVAALAGGVRLLVGALTALGDSALMNIPRALLGMATGSQAAAAAFRMLTAEMLANPMFWGTAIVGALVAFKKIEDALVDTYEEQKATLEELNAEYESTKSEYEQLKSRAGELNDVEKHRLELLEAENRELEKQRQLQAQETVKTYETETFDSGVGNVLAFGASGNYTATRADLMSELISKYNELSKVQGESLEEQNEIDSQRSEAMQGMIAYVREMDELTDAGGELSEEYKTLYDAMMKLIGVENTGTDTTYDAADAYSALSAAMKEYKENGELSKETVDKLNTAIPGLVDALYDEEGNLTAVGKAALMSNTAMASFIQGLYNAKIEGDRFTLQNVRDEVNTTSDAFKMLSQYSAIAARSMSAASFVQSKLGITDNTRFEPGVGWVNDDSTLDLYDQIISLLDSAGAGGGGGGGAGGGSGSSASKTDTKLEAYKDRVALLKSELTLMQKQGASAENQLSKIQEIQTALTEQANYMQSSGADKTDINGVLAEWWDWNTQTETIRDNLWDELIDSIKDTLSSVENIEDIEEKRLSLEEAKQALENAKSQRNVRIFTGDNENPWTWAANEGDIKSAEKSLKSAEESYNDALIDKELEDLLKAKGIDPNSVVIGSALLAKLESIPEEQMKSTANALHALYGTVNFAPSTVPQSMVNKNDSHDVNYYFPGGIKIGQEQAEGLTLARLAQQLRVLKLT